MHLLKNSNEENHEKLLAPLIAQSEVSILCSGWLNLAGLDLLLPAIDQALKNNAAITIYSNKKHTQKRAAKRLHRRESVKHFMVDHHHRYLHTKIFYFEKNNMYTAVVGSANLTKGGLIDNEELSVLLKGLIGDIQHRQVKSYLDSLNKLHHSSISVAEQK